MAAGKLDQSFDTGSFDAAAYIRPETGKRRWERVDKADLKRWTVRLLGEYSTAYGGNQLPCDPPVPALARGRGRPSRSGPRTACPDGESVLGAGVHQRRTFRLAQGVPGKELRGLAYAAILALFEATGIRLSELAGLRYDPSDLERSDLNLYGREVRVFGKGGKPRVVPFTFEAARALDRYLRMRVRHPLAGRSELWLGANGREPLTPAGVYQLVAKRGEQAGVAVHPQRFRHHFSHTWLDRGGAGGT